MAPLGARQEYGDLLGLPSPSRNPFPFLVGEKERGNERGNRKWQGGEPPPCPKPIRFGPWGARPTLPLLPSISTKAHVGPLSPRGVPVTPRYSGICQEPSRCLNIVIQYIDLYVSTISRLLFMSVITSSTPNNLRHIKTHKLII